MPFFASLVLCLLLELGGGLDCRLGIGAVMDWCVAVVLICTSNGCITGHEIDSMKFSMGKY
jgi:hypothetical protein